MVTAIASSSSFDSLINVLESRTGLTLSCSETELIAKWEKAGVQESDIVDAIQWRNDNNLAPLKRISQLAGGVETSRLKRVQGGNGRKAKRTASQIIDDWGREKGIVVDGN